MNAIECDGVSKRFGSVAALDGLTLTAPAGAVVGYLGPNGAGKSTTIRILLDLARADAGTVRVLGADPRRAGARLRHRIAYLPSTLHLDERTTVEQTFRFWAALRSDAGATRRALRLCDDIGLDHTRPTRGLSTGNVRKVGIVGAFMADADLLILDEPTSGLDPLAQEVFFGFVDDAHRRGQTVFLSSHVLSAVQRLADHIIVIKAGRAVFDGTVEALRRSAQQHFEVEFTDATAVAALGRVPGVRVTGAEGARASGIVTGAIAPFAKFVGRHTVTDLRVEEADLEEAFLELYDSEEAS